VFVVGDSEYPLCHLDTMAVSEMIKQPEGFFLHFYEWALGQDRCFVPCFSPFTLIELRRKPDLFQRFIERFRILPCVLLKGYDWLLKEEIESYPEPSAVDPCALTFTPLGGEGNLMENLPALMQQQQIQRRELRWNAETRPIVDGMVSLVPNLAPDGPKYTAAEIQQFVFVAGVSQLALREKHFVATMLERGEAVEVDAFPSLKASLYTTFYKFYVDKDRKPSDSDAFDVIISAEIPYVEAVITENHQAEVLRKTKQRDGFINHVRVFTLRDFREGPPA
jgi:hypothetical protein